MAFRCLRLLFHKFDTTLKQAHRFAMGAAPQCLFAGETEVADRARVIAAIPEMTSELDRVVVGLSSVRFHECVANKAMKARAASGRNTSIHRFAIKRVDETKTCCDGATGPLVHTCVADECPLAGESRTTQFRIVLRPTESRRQYTGHELTPSDAGGFQQQPVLRAESLQLLMDHGGQALRHAPAQLGKVGCRVPTV